MTRTCAFGVGLMCVAAIGCDRRADLLVDLRTDWTEASAVEIRVTPVGELDEEMPPPTVRELPDAEARLRGVRVAELTALPVGAYRVRARAVTGEGLVLGERSVLVSLEADTAATVLLTRSCAGVVCGAGEQCQAGRCVAPECSPEQPEACPEAECTIDLDCGGEFSECGVGRCVEGVCFAAVVEGVCGAEDVCQPYDGCVPAECATPRSRVVANWDVVPHQTVTTPFEVGVLAFHEHGSRVVFSVGGVEVGRSEAPVLSSRTGVPEHVLTLGGAYPDGPVTISAVAEPRCPGHDARALGDLTLYVNDGGTLSEPERWVDCVAGSDDANDGTEAAPYATIDRALSDIEEGGTVYLAAGDCYAPPTGGSPDRARWTTIRPAAGVSRDEVRIRSRGPDGSPRVGTSIRFQGVSIYGDAPGEYYGVLELAAGVRGWLDDVALWNEHPDEGQSLLHGGGEGSRLYVTGGVVRDVGVARPHFARGTRFERVTNVVGLGTDRVAVDLEVTVGDGRRAAVIGGYYPDGYVENVIVYGLRATGMGPQSFFGIEGATRDVAVVNTLIESDPPGQIGAAQLFGGWDHALMWHLTIHGTSLLLRGDTVRNLALENGSFPSVGQGQPLGWRVRHNHYAGPTSTGGVTGQDVSTGDPEYVDVAADDFRLRPTSPAARRGRFLWDVPFDIDGIPHGDGARAAGAHAAVAE